MTALDRAGALFVELRDIASRGAECPADSALAERLGCTEEELCDAFAFLAAAGMIDCRRVITITAADLRTAEPRIAA
jgi:DNA-binding FadR family transcriptional regulator